MKKSLTVLAGIAGISASLLIEANAAEITISSGYEGGTYHDVYARNLSQILTEHGHKVSVVTSAGSAQNLDRISSGEADVAFTQGDAYAAKNSNAEIIGSLGEECLFVAVGDHTGFDDEDDLQAEGVKIAVGEQGSGSALSWDYARQLEPDYMQASTYYQGGILAMSKVKAGQLDAFFWVTAPGNFDHKFIKAVQQDGSGLSMIDFNDWDMNDELPNGEQVYEFRDIDLETGMFADSVEVPCTDVMVVADGSMDSSALEDLAVAVMMNSGRITGK